MRLNSSREPTSRLDRRPGEFRAIIRNASWILIAKAAAGILSVVYLGLGARALGPHGFGAFVLILAFGQAVSAVAQFQSSEIVIRFGAQHLKDSRSDQFDALVLIAAGLDLVSALVSVAVALAIVFTAAGWLGIEPRYQFRAAAFAISFVVAIRGTPIGILRLLDRFDLSALGEFMLPVGRFIGAIISYFLFPTIDAFLISWVAAELMTTIAVWSFAIREARRRKSSITRSRSRLRQYFAANPQFWRFAWFTNLGASVGFFRGQAVTLLVGWGAGVSLAGAFRVAQQIAQALAKPIAALTRAVLPELSHLAAYAGPKEVLHTTGRLSRWAGIVAVLAVAIVVLFGKLLLELIAGPAFVGAQPLLVLLTLAAAVELWGFGQEPALLSLGRAGLAVTVKGLATLLAIALTFALMPRFGVTGAAIAVIIGNVANRAGMTIALWWSVRHDRPGRPSTVSPVDAQSDVLEELLSPNEP